MNKYVAVTVLAASLLAAAHFLLPFGFNRSALRTVSLWAVIAAALAAAILAVGH